MPKLNLTDLSIQRLKAPETGQVRYFCEATPGFGILVGKKAKTFFVITGKERRMTTLGAYGATSLKDARQRAKGILLAPSTPKPSMSFLEAVGAFEKARTGHVKATTLKRYRFYLDRLAFKGTVSAITKTDIKARLTIYDGKKRAQNACFAALHTFLSWCVQEDIIDKQPLYGSRLPNKTNSRDRVLTDAELVAIWNVTDYKPYGWLVRLAILTAGRRMELRNMVVEDDYIVFKATKNQTDHRLPITPLIRQHLLPQPYSYNNWKDDKDRLDKLSAVTGWVLHDCRRTWATNALRFGVTSDVVEATLNHKKTGIKAIYQRYNYAAEIREALLTVEAHVVKITTARVQPEPCTAPTESEHETVIEKAST